MNVNDVKQRGLQPDIVCLSCGGALVAKKGPVRADHFSHYSNVRSCGEGWLHAACKQALLERCEVALQKGWSITLPFDCKCGDVSKVDILQGVTYAVKERPFGSSRPDICLLDSNELPRVFIEIVHTPPENGVINDAQSYQVPLLVFRVKEECDVKRLQDDRLQPEWLVPLACPHKQNHMPAAIIIEDLDRARRRRRGHIVFAEPWEPDYDGYR